MLGHLIRKEILDHILSLRFAILAAIGALVIWFSLLSGYAFYQDRLKEYRLSQPWTEGHRQQRIESHSAVFASNFGYPVQKPPTPMSVFVRGAEPTLGQTAYVAAVDVHRFKYSPVSEEPILGIFPPLDLASVVQVVLSLFVLLMTFDAVCGEKEAGTLRLIASYPIPRAQLLLGKTIGALIPVLAAVGLPALLGIGVILAMPGIELRGPELLRLALVLLAFWLYLSAFACAGILGSCVTHRAATSFVLLLFFWVGTVSVLPRLSLISADMVEPAPSTQRLRAQINSLGQLSNQERHRQEREWREDYLKKHGEPHYNSPAGNEANTRMRGSLRDKFVAELEPQTDRLKADFRNRYDTRLALATGIARISPAFAIHNMTIRLAGTGIDRHRRFVEAYERARARQSNWYWKHTIQQGLSWANPEKYGKYDYDLSDLPRLVFEETWEDADIHAAFVDLGMLVLWGIVYFTGAFVGVLRYDVR